MSDLEYFASVAHQVDELRELLRTTKLKVEEQRERLERHRAMIDRQRGIMAARGEIIRKIGEIAKECEKEAQQTRDARSTKSLEKMLSHLEIAEKTWDERKIKIDKLKREYELLVDDEEFLAYEQEEQHPYEEPAEHPQAEEQ